MSIPTPLKRILAFDPGFERLGVAVVERNSSVRGEATLLFSDCVCTSKTLPFPERLGILGSAVEKYISQFSPDSLALETVYFEKNQKTAMDVAAVRGMLAYIAGSQELPVFEYTPLEVKVAVTGYGKSTKQEVGLMVPRLIALPAKKRLDDEMDAIAIGLTCLATTRGMR